MNPDNCPVLPSKRHPGCLVTGCNAIIPEAALDELNKRLAKRKHEVQALQESCRKHRETRREYWREAERRGQQIAQINKQIDQLQTTLDNRERQTENYSDALRRVQATVERLKAEREQAVSDAANLPDKLTKAHQTISRLQSKNARQRAAIAHMHANHTDPETLEELRDATQTLKGLCARLADFNTSKDEITALHAKLAKTRDQLAKARAENTKLRRGK